MQKSRYPNGYLLFWQRMRDSNPRERSQSPVCYRYTNPLYAERYYYKVCPCGIIHLDKKAFLSAQFKEVEENNRMGKTRDLFKKIRDTKGTFHAKMGTVKDRNGSRRY